MPLDYEQSMVRIVYGTNSPWYEYSMLQNIHINTLSSAVAILITIWMSITNIKPYNIHRQVPASQLVSFLV